MKNEFNLYPKNFTRAHDVKAKEYVAWQDAKVLEEKKKFEELLAKLRAEVTEDNPMSLKVEGLFIMIPEKLDDLKREGETLHHCVGTYINRVAKGETMIFFVRKEEEPEKPYYTMEWKNGKIIQCRGFRNCDPTPEVKAFTTIFEEKMAKKAG